MLALVGMNHRSAPLDLRERVTVAPQEHAEFLSAAAGLDGVVGVFLLSTCNRLELLAEVRDPEPASAGLVGLLARRDGRLDGDFDRYGYRHRDLRAVRHLFRVTSGLDSMILGEPQITGQVRTAHRLAREAGVCGGLVDRAVQQALAAAKRVRTETTISRNPVSVATAAVELAHQIFGDLRGASAVLLGAGKMSALVARHLTAREVRPITVASRRFSTAQALAQQIGGEAVNWNEAFEQMQSADIVISGTGASDRVLGYDDAQRIARARRGRPLFLVDIAVPRDIDPRVQRIANVYLYDIDGLQGVVDANMEARKEAARLAEDLIRAEVKAFDRWRQTQSIAPTISGLREAIHGLARGELARHRRRLGRLDDDQQQAVEALVRGIAQKIAHRPIRRLRGAPENGDLAQLVRLYREIFPLDETAPAEEGDGARPHRLIEGGRQED